MTDEQIFESARKVIDAFDYEYHRKVRTRQIALAAALREVIKLFSTSLPPDSNMDEFYARLYGGSETVVYVDEILRLCDKLEVL